MDASQAERTEVRTAVTAITWRSPWTVGALFWVGSLLTGGVNYLFNIVMAQEAFLGPVGFGSLAALSSLIYLDGVAMTTLMTVTAYAVASLVGRGEAHKIGALLTLLTRKVGIPAAAFAGLLVVGSPLLASFLHLESVGPVVLLAPTLFLTLLLGVTSGVLQGLLAFSALALIGFLGAVLRLGLSIPLVAAGLDVSGALLASVLAVVIGYVASLAFLRRHLRRGAAGPDNLRVLPVQGLSRYTGHVFVATFGLTALFSVDLLLAKHYLAPDAAGLYGGLATLGRVVYFATLPLTLVLFPVLTKRAAARRPTKTLLLLGGGGVVAIASGVVALAALFPEPMVRATLGGAYLAASHELWRFTLFYGFVSLATWLTYVFLAFRRTTVSLFPIGGALLQVLLIVRFHASVRAVLLVSLAAAGLLAGALAVGIILTQARERRSTFYSLPP